MTVRKSAESARWVFGYGSLMWRPDFPFEDRQAAVMTGVHRSLCVLSHVHRGTPERPGLVFGLNRGGSCRGIAYRVGDADWPNVLAYLREREQVTNVYLESVRRARLVDLSEPSNVEALCYIVDRNHLQFAGDLSMDEMVQKVSHGIGRSGHNRDYVISTAQHLDEIGVRDHTVKTIVDRL